MLLKPDNVYRIPAVQALLAYELEQLAPLLPNIPGQHGLFLHPCSAGMGMLPLSGHRWDTKIDLHLSRPDLLQGAITCTPLALPFGSESLQWIVIQHAFERMRTPCEFIAEASRVLAPEGILLMLGFNPWSVWRLWLAFRMRSNATKLHLHSYRHWMHFLLRHNMDVLQVRYIGGWLPQCPSQYLGQEPATRAFIKPWTLLQGAYVIFARKRCYAQTLLRNSQQRHILRPHLVTSAPRVYP